MDNKINVTIKNFGPIKHFEYDMTKPLIVTYGDNNIGKSYAMQVVYLLFKTLISFADHRRYYYYYDAFDDKEEGKSFKSCFLKLNEQTPRIEITEKINKIITRRIENEVMGELLHSFQATFGNFNSILEKKPVIILTIKDVLISFDLYNQKIVGGFYDFPTYLKLSSKNGRNRHTNSYSLTIYYYGEDDITSSRIYEIIDTTMFRFKSMVRGNFSNVYFLPASRSGIYSGMSAFSSIVAELSKNKGILSKKIELPGISEPISDYFIMLSNIRVRDNDKYKDIYKMIETDVLKGVVKYNHNKNTLVYVPDGMTNEFEMTEVSSMVSEISPIVAFLKYIIGTQSVARLNVESKFIVFIEEPEAHLHPQNQVKLVEIFSELPKYGVNLILSSHSNYVFNKLNNLLLDKRITPDMYEPIILEGLSEGSCSKKIEVDELGATDENFSDTTEKLYEEREAIIEKLMRGD